MLNDYEQKNKNNNKEGKNAEKEKEVCQSDHTKSAVCIFVNMGANEQQRQHRSRKSIRIVSEQKFIR